MTEKSVTRLAIAFLMVLASVILTLSALELAARVWVHFRWSDSEISLLTEDFDARFGFVSDRETGYQLEPDRYKKDAEGREFSHNSLGFRGSEFTIEKPLGEFRIVLMGASTVYGIYVGDNETSSARLEQSLSKVQSSPGKRIRVINAGVPGWTTRETLTNLQRSILGLNPDLILVMDGRNDIFPELFNNYARDYSHYRDLSFDFRTVNEGYRRLFRQSRLAMVLIAGSSSGDGKLGYSRRAEHPAYGYNRWRNRPSVDEIVQRVTAETIVSGFRDNLESMVRISADAGISLILASIPFDAERYGSGVIPANPRIRDGLDTLVKRNNAITHEIAGRNNLPFVDAASLSSPEYLVDDCHFNLLGEAKVADIMSHAVLPLIN